MAKKSNEKERGEGISRETVVTDSREVPTIYTNNATIETGPYDVRLHFGEVVGVKDDQLVVNRLAKVVMSPQHAYALAQILVSHLKRYEERFGVIPKPK